MKSVLITSALAAVAVAGSAAASTNLVKNGSFESANFSPNAEFGDHYFPTNVVTNWTVTNPNTAFDLYLDQTTTTVNAKTKFASAPNQKLAKSFTGPSPDGGRFVALDGDTRTNGALQQVVGGLVVGKTYDVKFYWAASQLQDRRGTTTEQLAVTFGGTTQSTAVVTNPSQGFQGWFTEDFKYKATGGSETLSFLSIGTPNGLPPIALLDGVSVTGGVPEAASWALLLVGFGVVGGIVRSRRLAITAA